VPPLVALVMAQAASFLVLNSALDVYQDREDVGVYDGLDLLSVTSCDV